MLYGVLIAQPQEYFLIFHGLMVLYILMSADVVMSLRDLPLEAPFRSEVPIYKLI